MALLSCRNERFGGIDGRYSGGTEQPDQLRRQRTRAAANVQHALTYDHICQGRKPGS